MKTHTLLVTKFLVFDIFKQKCYKGVTILPKDVLGLHARVDLDDEEGVLPFRNFHGEAHCS